MENQITAVFFYFLKKGTGLYSYGCEASAVSVPNSLVPKLTATVELNLH
eukprot:SAG31_NODE_196_length_20699_cov_103.813835_12_plen_49_part_00